MKCHKYLHQSLPPQLSILRASRLHHMFLRVMSSLPGRPAAAPAAAVPPQCPQLPPRAATGAAGGPAPERRSPGRQGFQRVSFPRHTLLLWKRSTHLRHISMLFRLKKGTLILKVLLSILNPASFKDHLSLKQDNHPWYFQYLLKEYSFYSFTFFNRKYMPFCSNIHHTHAFP